MARIAHHTFRWSSLCLAMCSVFMAEAKSCPLVHCRKLIKLLLVTGLWQTH
jgi:hypothetical protein